MRKKITKIGGSCYVSISPYMLEQLNIVAGDEVNVSFRFEHRFIMISNIKDKETNV